MNGAARWMKVARSWTQEWAGGLSGRVEERRKPRRVRELRLWKRVHRKARKPGWPMRDAGRIGEGADRGSATEEASVEGAGEAGVGGALDEGAAVGEDGEGVGRVGEAEEEAVGADVAEGLEAGLQGGEVDGVVVLVDLDGVAAAEGDVRALLAGEMAEEALATDFAVGARGGGGDLGAGEGVVGRCGPEVEGEQGAAHEMGLAGEELEGFGDLERGSEVDGGGEDAGGVAGFDVAGGGRGEDAGEARCRVPGGRG